MNTTDINKIRDALWGENIEKLNEVLKILDKEEQEQIGPDLKAIIELGITLEELTQLADEQKFMLICVKLHEVENIINQYRLAIQVFDVEGPWVLHDIFKGEEYSDELRLRRMTNSIGRATADQEYLDSKVKT